ncbi:MAG: dTDP-4-dehydrorhamnose reductase [bacterium]|nr:dTDP-4-dehydrorhamnose reductase [bacterium]
MDAIGVNNRWPSYHKLRKTATLYHVSNKLLIIGAKGMLGRALTGSFSDWELVCWDKEEIDITRESEVRKKISKFVPSVIVNAAAFTDVDACETNRELALAVNGRAVEYLAKAAREINATLVHYSTDYVFDGKNINGYAEDDEPQNPVNTYGESKLLGEQSLKSASGLQYYLIRTSWLFGERGKNFVRTMLDLGRTKERFSVVNDQHGKPTYAEDLAQATRKLIEKSYPAGTYHLVNEPATTWYDFAKEIFDADAAKNPGANKPEIIPCDSSVFPRPAKRPLYSALKNTKFPLLRPWREALAEYLKEMP